MQSTETNLELRLWTVEEYHRMNEAGRIAPEPLRKNRAFQNIQSDAGKFARDIDDTMRALAPPAFHQPLS